MPGDNEPFGVTISAREIYDQIVGLRSDVQTLTQSNENVTETLGDHEERIRGIERWKYGFPVAIVAALGSIAVTALKGSGVV